MSIQAQSPTVLVVDDDPNIIRRFQRSFMAETSLGVAAVRSLAQAKKLVDNRKIHFDAIVADLGFDPGMQSHADGLYTGIDLLALAYKTRPEADQYVISVFADEPGYKKHAADEKLPIIEWYEKLSVGESKPWEEIEANLFKKRIAKNKTWREALSPTDLEKVADVRSFIREAINPMTRNYLTIMSDADEEFEIINPIEVIGQTDGDTFIATALNIGLTQSGVGDDFSEAMMELQELILSHYENLISVSASSETRDVADQLKHTIERYIRRRISR